MRPEEQSEKAESCRENLWMKYSWKGHKDRKRRKNRIKKQTKLSIQVHGPHMTTSKKLSHVNSVHFAFSDNSWSVDLISRSTDYYRKQFLTACDPSPSISMLKTMWVILRWWLLEQVKMTVSPQSHLRDIRPRSSCLAPRRRPHRRYEWPRACKPGRRRSVALWPVSKTRSGNRCQLWCTHKPAFPLLCWAARCFAWTASTETSCHIG